jgi:hypothetical protein
MVCPASATKDIRKKTVPHTPGTELPRMLVDGFDAVAVYRVAHEAIDRARKGRGATLIECGSNCVQGQRRTREDAVVNMERYLRGKGILRRGMRQEIEGAFAKGLGGLKKKRAGV